MISLWSNDCLMNSWLNIPYDCVKFISYASYRNNLRKKVKFWPKIKIPLALDIKNWGFQLKKVGRGSRDKKMQKFYTIDHWPSSRSVEELVDRFVEAGNLKRPPRVISLTVFLISLKTLHLLASRDYFGLILGLIEGFGVDFGTHLRLGFQSET